MFHFLLAGLRQRPLRTLTCVATVSIALSVLTLTASGIRRVDFFASRTPDFLAVTSANILTDLPLSSAARVAKVEGVAGVEYFKPFPALDGSPEQRGIGNLDAASDGYFQMNGEGLLSADPALIQRWKGDRQGLIASHSTASTMGWKPDEMVSVTWQRRGAPEPQVTPFHFLGTYQGAEHESLVVHYEYIQQLLPAAEQGRIFLLGVFRNEGAREEADRAVTAVLEGLPDPMIAGPAKEWVLGGVTADLALTSLLEQMTVVMLLITLAIVGASTAMTLRERRPDIGTLRALGFTRSRVMTLLVAESALVAFLGYALGVLVPLAVLTLSGKSIDLGHAIMAEIRPGPIEAALAALVAGALALGVSAWPALSASRQDVIVALQEE